MSDKLKPFFLVLSRLGGETYIPERTLADAASYEETVTDIATGQIEDVAAVFKIIPAVRIAVDITVDVAQAVLREHLDANGTVSENIMPFLEDHLGCRTVAEALREAA